RARARLVRALLLAAAARTGIRARVPDESLRGPVQRGAVDLERPRPRPLDHPAASSGPSDGRARQRPRRRSRRRVTRRRGGPLVPEARDSDPRRRPQPLAAGPAAVPAARGTAGLVLAGGAAGTGAGRARPRRLSDDARGGGRARRAAARRERALGRAAALEPR